MSFCQAAGDVAVLLAAHQTKPGSTHSGAIVGAGRWHGLEAGPFGADHPTAVGWLKCCGADLPNDVDMLKAMIIALTEQTASYGSEVGYPVFRRQVPKSFVRRVQYEIFRQFVGKSEPNHGLVVTTAQSVECEQGKASNENAH